MDTMPGPADVRQIYVLRVYIPSERDNGVFNEHQVKQNIIFSRVWSFNFRL